MCAKLSGIRILQHDTRNKSTITTPESLKRCLSQPTATYQATRSCLKNNNIQEEALREARTSLSLLSGRTEYIIRY